MNIKKEINALRRNLMHRMTQHIGASHFDWNIDLLANTEIKRVLICRPNHRLGNLLLITPLVQEVIDTFSRCKIDLFVKGNIAPTIFCNYKNIERIIQLPQKPFNELTKYLQGWISIRKKHYDIVINADKNSSSGRLSAQFANSKYRFLGGENEITRSKYEDYEHLAKNSIYNFRDCLSMLGVKASNEPIAPLNLKLSSLEIANGLEILKKIVDVKRKTICLFTYATGNKCYSISWWLKFYKRLKTEYPDCNIIEVLPIENVSQIFFKAPIFYSRDIREIGSFIANTELFIGADSGIMHLASSAQVPTVGLFSVTSPTIYKPYGNNSVAINTSNSTIDDWINILDRILEVQQYKKIAKRWEQI